MFKISLTLYLLLLDATIVWGVTKPITACLSERFSIVDHAEEYSEPDAVMKQVEISKQRCFKKYHKCLLTLYIFRENGYGAYCGK